MTWTPTDRIKIDLPDADLTLQPTADFDSYRYAPDWSIETGVRLSVDTGDDPLIMDDHAHRFGAPIRGFMVFASDGPDDHTLERCYDPIDRTQVPGTGHCRGLQLRGQD